MTDSPLEFAEKAGQLTAFALRRRLLPSDDPEYAALVREFLTDSHFARTTECFLRGLGLRVLGASTLAGVVVGAATESPFRLHREDYHGRMSASDRIVQGIVHLAIAAWCFPRAEDLGEADDVLPARLSIEQLVEYIHSLCEELKAREEERQIAVPSPEVRMAWQHILALGKYADSKDGRRSFATLAGKVDYALRFLTDYGLLKREGPESRPTWLARPSLRIHVRELAGHEAWEIVSRAAKEVSPHG